MSDAPSDFKSARVQFAGQSKDYWKTTHLRMGHRSRLEPVGAGFAGNDHDCDGSFSADGLKHFPRVAMLRSARAAGVERRRVFANTHNEYENAGGQDV